MKFFLKFSLVISICMISVQSYANLDEFFNSMDLHIQKCEWENVDNIIAAIYKHAEDFPDVNDVDAHVYRFSLLLIKSHIARRSMGDLYAEILSLSQDFFPNLEESADDLKNALLVQCLKLPYEYIKRSKRRDIWVVNELTLSLATYYLYQNQLDVCETLLAVLIRRLSRTEDKALYLRANRLLGRCYFYQDDVRSAKNHIRKSLVDNQDAIEVGLGNLEFAELYLMERRKYKNAYDEAKIYLNGTCPIGEAYRDLLKIKRRFMVKNCAQKHLNKLIELEEEFRSLQDPFGVGLVLILRSQIIKKNIPKDNDNYDLSLWPVTLLSQARDLADEHSLPLLNRLVDQTSGVGASAIESPRPVDMANPFGTTLSLSTSAVGSTSDSNPSSARSVMLPALESSSSFHSCTSSAMSTPRRPQGLSPATSLNSSPARMIGSPRIPGSRVTKLALSGE